MAVCNGEKNGKFLENDFETAAFFQTCLERKSFKFESYFKKIQL